MMRKYFGIFVTLGVMMTLAAVFMPVNFALAEGAQIQVNISRPADVDVEYVVINTTKYTYKAYITADSDTRVIVRLHGQEVFNQIINSSGWIDILLENLDVGDNILEFELINVLDPDAEPVRHTAVVTVESAVFPGVPDTGYLMVGNLVVDRTSFGVVILFSAGLVFLVFMSARKYQLNKNNNPKI